MALFRHTNLGVNGLFCTAIKPSFAFVILENLRLSQFKNHQESQLHFGQKFICLTGKNGMGKTNLLDAIHYLSTGKSFFSTTDGQNIKSGTQHFTIEGQFQKDQEPYQIFCGLSEGKKKIIKKNKVAYDKILKHYGQFPCILIAPQDMQLILDGTEERRTFIERSLWLYDRQYLQHLVAYQQHLQQRNHLLKQHIEGQRIDWQLLPIYDQQMAQAADYLYPARCAFLDLLRPIFQDFTQQINNAFEQLSFHYDSQLATMTFLELMTKNRDLDRIKGRTSAGLHKDSFDFLIDQKALKKFGSQGQQKSYLLALKLSQAKILTQKTGQKPILLLDDLFDRLDDERAKNLIELVDQHFSQVFITDTSYSRLDNILSTKKNRAFFEINNGTVVGL